MDLVEEKLWIGGIDSALNTQLLRQHGIYHVVTVDIQPLPFVDGFAYFFIRARDLMKEDLLSFFSKAYQFIESGLVNNSVLVHCHQGISRSATIVLSYLMQKHKLSAEDALKRLQSVRPAVRPNQGFMLQLQLYESLLNFNQMESVVMNWYQLQNVAKKVSKRWEIPKNALKLFQTSHHKLPALKCKQCRQVLANDVDVINHQAGETPDWKSKNWIESVLRPNSGNVRCKAAYFTFPQPWMQIGSELQGKLQCPKCHSKIGGFSWSKSIKCPCMADIQPAFYLQASKVDEILIFPLNKQTLDSK